MKRSLSSSSLPMGLHLTDDGPSHRRLKIDPFDSNSKRHTAEDRIACHCLSASEAITINCGKPKGILGAQLHRFFSQGRNLISRWVGIKSAYLLDVVAVAAAAWAWLQIVFRQKKSHVTRIATFCNLVAMKIPIHIDLDLVNCFGSSPFYVAWAWWVIEVLAHYFRVRAMQWWWKANGGATIVLLLPPLRCYLTLRPCPSSSRWCHRFGFEDCGFWCSKFISVIWWPPPLRRGPRAGTTSSSFA